MTGNLRTFKETRNFIGRELSGLYPAEEIRAISDILLSHVLGTGRYDLLGDHRRILLPEQSETVIRLCRELKSGKPVQYVTGETLFYGCRILVGPGVLIPRPETEELVDLIVRENRDFRGTVADIGTGSGCIAVALARNLPDCRVIATDISEEALKKAVENSDLNHTDVAFVKSDIFAPGDELPSGIGIIASNPPYVRLSEKKSMHINITGFEPSLALFVPDDDPLKYYRAIIEAGQSRLMPPGKVYFEINEAMGRQMAMLLDSRGYGGITVVKDINGKDRIIKAVKQ